MTIYSLDLLLFQIWNQSVVPCPVLTVASWPAYRFLMKQVRWSGIPISLRISQFLVIHIIKGFSIVNEADIFLEFSCFFYDPMDVGNLISVCVNRSVMPDSLRPHGLQSTRFLCPWDFPGKDTGVGCHFLLQGIFPTNACDNLS